MKRFLKKHWLDIAIVVMALATALYFINDRVWEPRREEARRAQLADALLQFWEEAPEEGPEASEATEPATEPSTAPTAAGIPSTVPEDPGHTAPETTETTAKPKPKPVNFDAVVGLLRVPSWGTGYAAVIVDGVSDSDLKTAVGHFPDSAMPGEIGNCALAAHRTAGGGLFHNMHKLGEGNTVVIETKTMIYVYEIYGEMETVPADKWDEVGPVPHDGEAEPTESLITLQGCEMNREGTKRVILHGRLTEVREKN